MFELLDKFAALDLITRPSTKDALSSLLATVWQHVLVIEFCQRVSAAVGVTLTILSNFGPILEQIARDGETLVEIPNNTNKRLEACETIAQNDVNEVTSTEFIAHQVQHVPINAVSRRIPRKPRGKRVAELVLFWENISLQNQEHNRRLHVRTNLVHAK
ncbi:hypothetical protein BSKO_04395 [Bryopsis sp. KO-2023]|nr:hypothetical protein BSKO_04395 [Bryopsis sp. KO-2023]